MKSNILAVLHPESRLQAERYLLADNRGDVQLTDSMELAVLSILENEYDYILVDSLLLFTKEYSALRWIKFLNPNITIRFFN
jgi:hypothetical protein